MPPPLPPVLSSQPSDEQQQLLSFVWQTPFLQYKGLLELETEWTNNANEKSTHVDEKIPPTSELRLTALDPYSTSELCRR